MAVLANSNCSIGRAENTVRNTDTSYRECTGSQPKQTFRLITNVQVVGTTERDSAWRRTEATEPTLSVSSWLHGGEGGREGEERGIERDREKEKQMEERRGVE